MQPIRFHNTLGRKLSPFEPLTPGKVGIYTCGPTVYNHAHIGNLRTFLFEDLLRRVLRFLGYEVTQVMNLTDVDDKTIREAAAAGVELDDYTAPFIESFFEDVDTLRIERAEVYPRATRHIDEMIAMIAALMEKGVAYEADGSVFFRISEDEDYGRLSGFDLEEVRTGERVASDEYGKEDVRDFVLWKGTKPGEPSWPSPWGPGRPGWHIECSAMSMRYLGETFDIHTGGVDNIFPHHENEIAQSESTSGKPFVRYWLHAEHLIVDGEKMSKSAGNFYTLKELLARGAEPRAMRYLLLATHYRKKLNFTFEGLDDAAAALRRLDTLRFRLDHAGESGTGAGLEAAAAEALEKFTATVADDLNVAGALGELFAFSRKVNVAIESGKLISGDRQRVLDTLDRFDTVLGVLNPDDWSTGGDDADDDSEIEALVAERQQARADRDFARADEIRARLTELEVTVEDTPDGPRWKRG